MNHLLFCYADARNRVRVIARWWMGLIMWKLNLVLCKTMLWWRWTSCDRHMTLQMSCICVPTTICVQTWIKAAFCRVTGEDLICFRLANLAWNLLHNMLWHAFRNAWSELLHWFPRWFCWCMGWIVIKLNWYPTFIYTCFTPLLPFAGT